MRFYWLVIGVLAVWRITYLLYGEDGPWDVLVKFRRWLGSGFFGRLLDCFYCLSVWVALPFALIIGAGWSERLLLWPALSGGAILLERSTGGDRQPLKYLEREEQDHGVLWREKTTDSVSDGAGDPGT